MSGQQQDCGGDQGSHNYQSTMGVKVCFRKLRSVENSGGERRPRYSRRGRRRYGLAAACGSSKTTPQPLGHELSTFPPKPVVPKRLPESSRVSSVENGSPPSLPPVKEWRVLCDHPPEEGVSL